MKKALFLDTTREIKHSFGRFLSILLIVALGCGFFAGLKATMPDMIDTASDYFIDNNLMDYKLMSGIGIKSEDVQAVRKADGVNGVAPGYSRDVYYRYDNQNCVLKVMSFNVNKAQDDKNNLNKPVLIEGRMPEKSGECVIEVKMSTPDTFKIGNEISIESPYENEDISDVFANDTFEIVGIVTSPLYIGYERDATNIGNGKVLSNIFVLEEEFVLDYYSEMYITFDGLDDYDPFSDEYKNAVDDKKKSAVTAFENSVNSRYEKLLDDANEKIQDAQTKADTLEKMLASDVEQLLLMQESVTKQLEDTKKQYDEISDEDGAKKYVLKSEIGKTEENLELLSGLISAKKNDNQTAISEYENELSEARNQISDSSKQLENIKSPKVYEFDRFSNSDYSSYKNDSTKVDAVAKVFPVFFILIAALVCLTTMTRMVEEQRIQIGTYKALGYSSWSILSKYLAYAALASVIGSSVGTTIGMQIFPKIIYNSYKIMYNIPEINTPFKLSYMVLCMLVSLICICSAVVYSCIMELKAQPSQLLRSKPPAKGKRVFLENVPFIWKRLDFLAKVTVRNLFRYKKRFLMTIIGVAGCTALIIAGFGLKYSIKSIADKQFNEITVYDASIVLTGETSKEREEQQEKLVNYKDVKSSMAVQLLDATAEKNGENQSVTLTVPENIDEFEKYIIMRDVKTNEILNLNDNQVIITEKLAQKLNVKIGDTFTIKTADKTDQVVKIGDVVKNYAMHFVFMSPELFSELYGSNPNYNIAFLNIDENADHNKFKEKLVEDNYLGVSFKDDNSENFYNSIDSLDSVVFLLVFCAGFLAVIVLYNLANINITERVREIATIKVLGFYDNETSAYIYRENIISTILGILVGLVLGKTLHYFVVITTEIDNVMFNRELIWWSCLFGAGLTILFSLAVNVVLHFKLKKIDMVESLKSVE